MVRFVEDDETGDESEHSGLAPVIPLFAPRGDAGARGDAPAVATPVHERAGRDHGGRAQPDRDHVEQMLVKRLRTRQLSVREARGIAREQGLTDDLVDEVVEAFVDRGYLDDARLAEQLVHAAVGRKGHGRTMIAQTLSRRGIAADTVDAALAELPDDDAERALDFARQKARSMGSLDRDAALRRLHGQLARRGFPGSVAMTAARTALAEAGIGASTVRFR